MSPILPHERSSYEYSGPPRPPPIQYNFDDPPVILDPNVIGPQSESLTEQLLGPGLDYPWLTHNQTTPAPPSPSTSLNELEMETFGRRITTNSYIPVNITPSVAVSNSRPSGRPRKEITLPTPAVIAQFELLIHVILPDKVTRTANRKTKTTKQDPLKFGPKDADTNLPWDGFLGKLAEMVQTGVKNLVVASFEWHFLKPTTSPKLPINSPNGFQSMMKQILGKNGKKDGDYIIVRMMPPTKEQSVAVPWAATVDKILGIPASPDEDVLSDVEDNLGPMQKRARLDDELEGLVEELLAKYPPGVCNLHPDKACFHHRVLDLHFDLERARLLVWSAAIRSGKADKDRPPMGSNLFKAQHAMRKTNGKKAEVIPLATPAAEPTNSVPAPFPPVQGNPYMQQFPPFGYPSPYAPPYMSPFPMPAPYGGPPNWPTQNHEAAPRAGSSRDAWDDPRSSSPPIPDCGVHDFCKDYKLGPDAEQGLQKLEFQIGDIIDTLPEAAWKEAGFSHLGWKRVLVAYAKYKRHAKRH
ncbi:hypothetical protein C8R44DRAFT_745976 [Mycena epipterygia]|nr:hypothetical protein C8R44DRAFT_745976 [Mycena epipterygia]